MAARENQGLQIALIVFVVLTVLLSLTTFVFFRNYQGEQIRAKSAEDKETTAKAQASALQEERNAYAQYLGGYSSSEKKETIDGAWEKDRTANKSVWGENLPDEQKNYHKLVDGLLRIINIQHGANEKLALDLRNARAEYEKQTADYEKAKKDLSEEKTKQVTDYLTERGNIQQANSVLNASKLQMETQLKEKDKKLADTEKTAQGDIASLSEKYKTSQKTLHDKAEQVNNLSGKFTVNSQPDGRIVSVNERDRVAYINLGSADGLHKRITFSVFDPVTTDVSSTAAKKLEEGGEKISAVSEAKKKGTIEVVNVTEPHLAECRILEDSASHPLVSRDLVYTPLWHPGQQEHFALVGVFDVDGDGIADTDKVLDIIRNSGGVVDARTDDKGNVVGALTSSTRYLVRGKSEQSDNKAPLGYTKLTEEAKALGIETISLARFLDLIGYTPPPRAGTAATASEVAPAGTPSANFRPRVPPSRGQSGSAF